MERRIAEASCATRLSDLVGAVGLDALDVLLLLAAVAPDVDPRFERFYAYLHDDVTRRRPSVGLALELAGAQLDDARARARLGPDGPLCRNGLVLVEDGDRPLLGRSLRAPDRVVEHLVGGDGVERTLERCLVPAVGAPGADGTVLLRGIAAGARLTYLRDGPRTAAAAVAVGALDELGLPVLAVDLDRVAAAPDLVGVLDALRREAVLTGAAVVAGPIDALAADLPALDVLTELPVATVLFGTGPWDPRWSRWVPLVLDAPVPDASTRHGWWTSLLTAGDVDAVWEQRCRLKPHQLTSAVAAAELLAAAEDRPMGRAHLQAGARGQRGVGLERLARRIVPSSSLDDLVLPDTPRMLLQELVARARHSDMVIDQWGVAPSGRQRMGVIGLFAGPPGTGKTMSAEAVAHELGLDLYVLNMATVVDKYIGETEKNLDRLFEEAEQVDAVLFFDEADAIFGKRSEVKDARDRYANLEVAYLLQRLERFDGMGILATNLRSNLDDAFLRRIDVAVDFAIPNPAERRALWDRMLPPGVPLGPDVDLEFLSGAFELSGGSIRNIAVCAGFLAAAAHGVIGMDELVRATEREYRKLGRLRVESEFGPYHELVGAVV